MPRICYVEKEFRQSSLDIIESANEIIDDYTAQGFDLTLRQLYYQFVARDLLPNTRQSYNRLGSIINDARLAGLIDWNRLIDRTRNLQSLEHWDAPGEIIDDAAGWYNIDKWGRQDFRPEVWIEKDALVGVIEGVCQQNDVAYFSCRGYTSQSEMWRAAQRLVQYQDKGQTPVIFHLGDHDPSGIDMSRDIEDRLELFGARIRFERIALNMPQIEEFNPPPNPAKVTDSRAPGYIAEHGNESWELDAMDPAEMARLISLSIDSVRDDELWSEDEEREESERGQLQGVSQNWSDIVEGLDA